MNSFFAVEIINFLIVPAAVIGVARWRWILPVDRPLVCLLWLGTLSELLGLILALTIKNNIACFNIYAFFDGLVLAQVFHNWGCLKRKPWMFRCLQILLLTVWIWENHNKEGLLTGNQLFPVLYSSVLVFMGIDRINAFIVSERYGLLRNGRFLITMAVVISSSYEAFQQVVFWIYRDFSFQFYEYLSAFMEIAMIFVNVALAIGVWRLPRRERFTLSAF